MNGKQWRVAAASVIGSSHIKTGAPCQDAHAVAVLRGGGGEILIAALSDGAGSASLSNVASRVVCKRMLELAAQFVGEMGGHVAPDEMTIRSWVADARSELQVMAQGAEVSVRDFACTLLFSMLADKWSAYAHIGDGAICVPDEASGEWCWITWPQKGEYANATNFLIQENWTEQLNIEIRGTSVNEVALFTDGIENLVLVQATRAVHSQFFNAMFPAVRASAAHGLDRTLAADLAAFLSSERILSRTDDDKTLVLASRSSGPASEPCS